MKKFKVLLLLSLAFALPGPGQAEAEEAEGPADFTMEEVIVTATKTEEKRKDIPNAVVIIDETEIQESPAKTLGELLANELGVDWRTYGDYGGAAGMIRIRGMSADGTQVRVNGVSINSPSLGTADVSAIPLNSIERIEVVKGSGSLLYGSGAMAGTINIITKRPKKDRTDLKASAGYGSQSTYLLSAEQGMFAFGDLGYYLTANQRKTDGFRDNSDLVQNDVSLKMVLDKGKALDISLYGDLIDRRFGRPGVKPPPGTQSYFINGTEFTNSESASLLDKGSTDDAHGILQVKSRPADWLDLYLRGDYTYMQSYNYDRYNYNAKGSKTWVTNKIFGAEGDVTFRPLAGASLLLGSEYKAYTWRSQTADLDGSGEEHGPRNQPATAGLHSVGYYAEAQYRPCKYVKGLAGIRHEDHSQFGTENLPRFGLIFNPFENTALKATTGRHFLAPTPNDLFWPWEDWGWYMGVKGNDKLRPETGWHTDATIEQSFFEDRLFITLSYFFWDVKDKIQWAPVYNQDPDHPGYTIWTPQNLNKFKGDGWEVGAKIGPVYDLTLAFDYTYTDAREELHDQHATRRASYTPRHQFRADLTYWTNFGLTATVTARYVGERYYYKNETLISPTATISPYWTADLKLDQRLFDHWIFSIQGTNLFNKEYDTYKASFTDPTTWQTSVAGFPGAGRSVFFNVTYEY